jgi:transcriptional regulator with XRE-family HTH domain
MTPDGNLERLGNFIREQRQRADLSLRELAARTSVSNPYLSQIERGLHEPSVRILRSIAVALKIPAATLLAEAGLLEDTGEQPRLAPATEIAIEADPELTDEQRAELLAHYKELRSQNRRARSAAAASPRSRTRPGARADGAGAGASGAALS